MQVYSAINLKDVKNEPIPMLLYNNLKIAIALRSTINKAFIDKSLYRLEAYHVITSFDKATQQWKFIRRKLKMDGCNKDYFKLEKIDNETKNNMYTMSDYSK